MPHSIVMEMKSSGWSSTLPLLMFYGVRRVRLRHGEYAHTDQLASRIDRETASERMEKVRGDERRDRETDRGADNHLDVEQAAP